MEKKNNKSNRMQYLHVETKRFVDIILYFYIKKKGVLMYTMAFKTQCIVHFINKKKAKDCNRFFTSRQIATHNNYADPHEEKEKNM